MGSIAKRPDGKWRARYRDHRGKEHARHFSRKVDAQAWIDKVTASQIRGDYVDPRDSKTLLEDYAKRWRETHVTSEGSGRIYDSYLSRHIVPALGALPLGTIRRSDVQGLVTTLTKNGLAANTVVGVYALLRQIMQSALDDKLIPASPCQRIKLPKAGAQKMVIPTVEQITIVRDSLLEPLQPIVTVLAATGLRIGEALGLQVRDVSLTGRTISVERQRTGRGKITKPKTESSVRVVPFGSVAERELAALVSNRAEDDWLFIDEFGHPVNYWNWQNSFNRLVKKLGYEFTTHDLRHFAASALISGGASVKQVQTFLGHSSASTTLDTYSHLWPGDEDRTRTVLDAALASLPARLRPVGTVPASQHAPEPESVTEAPTDADLSAAAD